MQALTPKDSSADNHTTGRPTQDQRSGGELLTHLLHRREWGRKRYGGHDLAGQFRPGPELTHTSQRDGRRARVILLAAQGCSRIEIARLTGFSLPAIGASVFKRCDWTVFSTNRAVGAKYPCRLTPRAVSLNRLLSRESASLDGAVGAWRWWPVSRPPACTDSGPPMT